VRIPASSVLQEKIDAGKPHGKRVSGKAQRKIPMNKRDSPSGGEEFI
jgi:hypothetical protein